MRYKYKSEVVKCEFCGKECRARGLQTHIRLKHKLKMQVIRKVISESICADSTQQYVNLSDKLSKDVVITKVKAKIKSENLSSHLCSEPANTSEQDLITKVTETSNELSPVRIYRKTGNVFGCVLFDFKDYFMKHQEEAKVEWARLVKCRFYSGDISWTKDRVSQALDSLSYGLSPFYSEFLRIEMVVKKQCMLRSEKLSRQYGWDNSEINWQ